MKERKRGLTPFLLALIAGAAAVLAFAPFGAYPVALASFALLALLWLAEPARCFWTGWAFGLGLFGAGVSWVYVSLSRFGGMPPLLAGIATVGLCAFLALFPAGAGWLQARIPATPALRAALLVPAAWTLFEWLRSWLLTGFPWLSAGYAAIGWPLQGYAPLLGVFGVSFLTAAAGGLLLLAYLERKLAYVLAFAALVVAGQALRYVHWTTPVGAPVTVSLLQGDIPQAMKFSPERYAQTLQTYARLAQQSAGRLIVFPETALPRFLDEIDPRYLDELQAIARRNGGDALIGVLFRRDDAYYNAVLSLGVAPAQLYQKAHLVPFGEFVPPGFGWTLDLLHIPLSDFSRGPEERAVLSIAGQRVAPNICYEDAFGAEIARQLPEATLLVNVSNVAWFGDSLAPAQHLQIAQMRAVETGRAYLTAANSGITASIDADGRVSARLPQFREGRLEVAAQGRTGATPYVRLRDWPIVLMALALLAAAAFAAARRR
ncbi:MAG TPA: apolipoprotein N-acyltransferase [Burkholderiales bacterium]|nr:apolipoprotein N-acyltransferase [Burkholderiales bacterium]